MRYVAVDAETRLITPGNLQPEPVVFSFAERGTETFLELPDAAAARLRALLQDKSVKLIGHSVSYDLGVLVKWYPDTMPLVFAAYDAGRITDTKVRQQLIDIAAGCLNKSRRDQTRGYSLADLEHHYLGRQRFEEKADPSAWRMRYAELIDVPLDQWPEAAVRYAKADAQGTLEVYEAQGAAPAGEDDSMRAAWALHLASCHGVRIDAAAVAELEASLLEQRKANSAAIQAAGFMKAEPLSAEDRRSGVAPSHYEPRKKDPKGLGPRPMKLTRNMAVIKAKVEAAYVGRPQPRTESGAVSTDRDTLEQSGDPALEALGAASAVEKLLTTYVPLLKKGTEAPINARFNVLVNSGRTSCGEPNLQNLPRAPGVRECFVPRPGHLFVSADFDTLELRALAQVCLVLFGKSKMAEAIAEGKDLHLDVAAQLLGTTYADAEARKKSVEVKEARQFAKVANFGLPGGLGITTLREFARTSYGVDMSEAAARRLKDTWLRTWPEMVQYFAYVSRLVGEGEATIKSFGNGMLRGGAGYCDTANHFFQNLAAQGAKDALFYIAWECYVPLGTPLHGCRPWNFVHDEYLLEVPEATAHEASARLVEVAAARMATRITQVPITLSPALMPRWLKGAEPVYVDGRLVPWSPPLATAA